MVTQRLMQEVPVLPCLCFFACLLSLSSDALYTAPHGKPRILIQTYVGFKAPHFFSRKVSTFADWLKVLTFGYLRIILSGIFSCKPFKSVHNNIQSFKHGKNFRGQFNKWNYSQTSDWQTASCIQKLWTRSGLAFTAETGKCDENRIWKLTKFLEGVGSL